MTKDNAHLHANGSADWDISPEVLSFLRANVKPGMQTLETGAGRSTLVFLEQGATHTAVTPAEDEIINIKRAAEAEGLAVENLKFAVGLSQDRLPEMDGELDLVLIDGGHGFPIPAIDWLYSARRLKVGGFMLIDDVDLWTGSMITNFMDQENCWEKVALLRGRTAVYKLRSEFELHEWTKQPFVVQKSKWPQRWRKIKNLTGLVLSGKFGLIAQKISTERRLSAAAVHDY